MAYVGRTRQIRMRRAELRFEAPVFRTYFHPIVVYTAIIREKFPDVEYVVFPDDESRN